MKSLSSPLLRHSIISFIDQGVLSTTNFLVTVFLIREIPPEQFSVFVLTYAGILLAVGFQNALVTTPMTVTGPKKTNDEKRAFVSSLAVTQYVIWLPLCLAAAATAIFFGGGKMVASVIPTAGLAAIFVFLREFMRRAFFLYNSPVSVLIVDVIYSVLFLGAVLLFSQNSASPARDAVLAMAGASALGGLFGVVIFHKTINWRFSLKLDALTAAWRHGRWNIMGVTVTWLSTQGFFFLLEFLRDGVAVTNVKASQQLLMPIVILLTSLTSVIKPRGAAWLSQGKKKTLFRVLGLITLGMIVLAAVYVTLLSWQAELLSTFIYKRDIAQLSLLLLLWGGVMAASILRTNLATLLQIFEKFNVLFYIGAAAALATLGGGYAAISLFGAPGSLVGLFFGELTFLIGMSAVIWQRGWHNDRKRA